MHKIFEPKHMVFPLILILLFTNVLPFLSMELGGGEQLIVDKQGGDYSSIQAAVDNASAGDSILVKDGTYDENVKVDKSLKIKGESREFTIINGSGQDPALNIRADGCTVSKITIDSSTVGIQIEGNESTIHHCDLRDNERGLVFYGSSDTALAHTEIIGGDVGLLFWNDTNSTVENVSVDNTNGRGMRFVDSANSTVYNSSIRSTGYHATYISDSRDISLENSTLENNSRGLYIYRSSDVCLRENHLSMGIDMEGDLHDWYTHTIENNTVTNGTLRFMKDRTEQRVADHTGQLIMLNCTDSTVLGGNMTQLEAGLILVDSSCNKVIGSTFQGNRNGIVMYSSKNNTLHHNNFQNNIHQIYSNDNSPENNTWDDGLGVGNYWDDYEGLDNGTDGRYKNDGVGDTDLKHPSTDHGGGYHQLDSNPLMNETRRIERKIELNGTNSGWNFISTGLADGFDTVSELLSHIEGNYEKIMRYEAGDSRWKTRVRGRADRFNDNILHDRNTAFWISVDSDVNLSITGFSSPRTLTEIHPGWNMVGCAIGSNISGSELPLEVDKVARFNESKEYLLDHHLPGEIELEAGKGYWIHSSAHSAIQWNQEWT